MAKFEVQIVGDKYILDKHYFDVIISYGDDHEYDELTENTIIELFGFEPIEEYIEEKYYEEGFAI